MDQSARDRLEAELVEQEALLLRLAGDERAGGGDEVAEALYAKGQLLGKLERREEALQPLEALIELFEDSEDPSVQPDVSATLAFNVERLYDRDALVEAVAVCDQLLLRVGNGMTVLSDSLSMAMGRKGLALVKLNRSGEAAVVY